MSIKWSALPAVVTVLGTDIVCFDASGVSSKITASNLATALFGLLPAQVPATRTITIAGTANQVISSAGAQDLSANRTWTLSLPQSIATTSAVRFAQMGIGVAPVGVVALTVNATTLGPGITVPAFNVIHPGLAGNDVNCYQVDATAGDPYMTIGQVAVNHGVLFQYQRSTNNFRVGIHGSPTVNIDGLGDIHAPNNIFVGAGYVAQGNPGLSATFDIGGGNTQITFTGGIATAIV